MPYSDERDDLHLDSAFHHSNHTSQVTNHATHSTTSEKGYGQESSRDGPITDVHAEAGLNVSSTDIENVASDHTGSNVYPAKEIAQSEIIVIDWCGKKDVDNPLNWSLWKKAMILITVNYASCMVYMAAAIYTVSQKEVEQVFGVSTLVATLPFGSYIIGYGIGKRVSYRQDIHWILKRMQDHYSGDHYPNCLALAATFRTLRA